MVASSKRYQFKIFFALYFEQNKYYKYSTINCLAKISNASNGGVGIM